MLSLIFVLNSFEKNAQFLVIATLGNFFCRSPNNSVCRIVCQLMKRGADQRLRNHRGESALELAVEGKHADIVTL